MAVKYYALLTNRGAAKLAAASALGTKLNITQMAVGDGGGTLPTPDPAQTALKGEKRRAALNLLTTDPVNTSQIIAEQVIPEDEGGWWIREVGLYDGDGELIAVANCAETYKPLLNEGTGRTQTIRMVLIVSSTEAVTLKIDPSVVLATRAYVDSKVIEVKAYSDAALKAHTDAANPHAQYALKASPNFTGTPKAPTPVAGDSSTQLATTAYVQTELSSAAPGSAAKRDVGTGANQIPDMNAFPCSLEVNGWEKMPSGRIRQWGLVQLNTPESGAAKVVTLPIPFPNAVLSAQATLQESSYQSGALSVYVAATTLTTITLIEDSGGGSGTPKATMAYWEVTGK